MLKTVGEMKTLLRVAIMNMLMMLPLVTFAGEGGGAVVRAVRRVLTFIDSMAVSGVDRRYIGVPGRPWQVVVRGNVNRASLTMSSTIDAGEIFADLTSSYVSEPRITSGNDAYIGAWGGYRGYGLGYMHQVSGSGRGSLFTLGATGGSYGVNFRRHSFETDEFDIYNEWHQADGTSHSETFTTGLLEAIKVKSFILDGYYMFNGSRYSYAAAYDQSAYQLRSAGSLMVGGMYYYSNIDYETPLNAGMIMMMDNIGRLRQWQVSLGAGYAYNYVPARGVLISGMLMPMLTLYNRLKIYRFDSKMRQMGLDNHVYGEDDQVQLLIQAIADPSVMEMKPLPENPVQTENSRVRLNFNARASLTYNLGDRAYLNVYGQLYNFRFSHDDNHGALTEWFANSSIGVRF